MQCLYGRFFAQGDSSGQRNAAAIISFDHEKVAVAIDDGDRSTKRAENREPVIGGEAGASDDPEKMPLQILERCTQAESLADELTATWPHTSSVNSVSSVVNS